MLNNTSLILSGLNEEQKSAVQCVDGPVLIVAGAGSGKTRVLTSRIAYLLERGCEAERILALTFTKKAAGEMKERVAQMVGAKKSRRLQMGTFHSVFVKFLREYAPSMGYTPNFTIYDSSDSLSAIKACIKELELDDKAYKPKEIQSRISKAKNNLITDKAYRSKPEILNSDIKSRKPRICDIYTAYAKRCKQSDVMDFDDILVNMNILLRDNPEAAEVLANRFSYIMVDEYQDTNVAQYLILKKLAMFHKNICVVGDDSQSIYAFRGARIENILNFKKDYPNCRTFRLERNYRSTQTIVGAANSLIAKNSGRIPKECYSKGDLGEKIKLIRASTEQEEAILLVSAITSRMREDLCQYKDFAILYRTNSQSRALEEALRRRSIPYMIYSGNAFYDRMEVKDMMAYFKLAVNPDDDESFKRVVNKPARGIGATSMEALQAAARSQGISLMRAAGSEGLEAFGLKKAASQRLNAFAGEMGRVAASWQETNAHELALRLADKSGLYAFYKSDTSIEGQSRFANLEELLNSVAAFVDRVEAEMVEEETVLDTHLGAFLEDISLLSNVDVQDNEEDGDNKVALMTVHSAKGLEYPYVFVAGMEENLFPGSNSMMSPVELEEERRLFYVALTRACKAVSLSYSDSRMRNGKHESNSPSRFLREIDDRFLKNPLWSAPVSAPSSTFTDSVRLGTSRSNTQFSRSNIKPLREPDPNFIPDAMHMFRSGQRIEHNRFGSGRINDITGKIPELKATITFDDYGDKIIMLKYAKMRIIK